ncbi:hypothetical protein PR048_007181 [Dryococelus australis]|uniref:Uncharacterized protein n=1 Tax=Dryococelus australis TaxID=614101 RepID=A0ABQ9ICZ2_9NEOP|nr:hypothetical protein PR048_007181 [Dryococelus australis]
MWHLPRLLSVYRNVQPCPNTSVLIITGPRWCSGQTTRLPPRRTGCGRSRIFACGNRAGRCRCSTCFLGELPFPPVRAFRSCSILTSLNPRRLSKPRCSQPPKSFQSPLLRKKKTHGERREEATVTSGQSDATASMTGKMQAKDTSELERRAGLDCWFMLICVYPRQAPLVHHSPSPPPYRALAERLDCSPSTKADRVQPPAGSHPGCSHVGIVPGDAAGWRVFSGISRFPALAFRRCFMLTSLHPRRRRSRPRC